jgi:membrane protein
VYLSWFRRHLFRKGLDELRGIRGRVNRSIRVVWFAARDFRRDLCHERAATLSFATIISLIPFAVLFVSFAVQIGAGAKVTAYLEEKVFPLLAPDFQSKLSEWLQNNISQDAFQKGLGGIVGFVALVTLILSALGVVTTAERSFNRLWKVRGTRTFLQRLTTFWVVLTSSPFILAASSWVEELILPKGGVIEALTEKYLVFKVVYSFLVPISIGFFGFTVLYYFLPSTRVQLLSAISGGFVAAMLWEVSKRSFYLYVAKTSSVYGSLAIVPLFLVWIYVNWLIILWGCEMAHAQQNLAHLSRLQARKAGGRRLPPPFVGVYLLERIGRSFLTGAPLSSTDAVSEELGINAEDVEAVGRSLAEAGLLIEDSVRSGCYALGKAPGKIPLSQVVELLSDDNGLDELPPAEPANPTKRGGQITGTQPGGLATKGLFQKAREGHLQAFQTKSLADLLDSPY